MFEVSDDSDKGRIVLDPSQPPPPPFALFSERVGSNGTLAPSPDPHTSVSASTIKGIEVTPLAKLFFSRHNLAALQHGIRYRVWVETSGRHVISNQSDTEIFAVMRGMYLQYSRNEPYRVVAQVRELNGLVLDFCVGRIVSEIQTYLRYRRDISTPIEPMERGQLATTKGSRQLGMFEP